MCKHTLVNEVDAELKKTPGVVALVNDHTGQVAAFMAPVPYWKKDKAQGRDAGSGGDDTSSPTKTAEQVAQARNTPPATSAKPTAEEVKQAKKTLRAAGFSGL